MRGLLENYILKKDYNIFQIKYMEKKLMTLFIGFAALILMGAACTRPAAPIDSGLEGKDNQAVEDRSAIESQPGIKEAVNGGGMAVDTAAGDVSSAVPAVIAQSGKYLDYSPSLATSEQEAGRKVVLFFHAPWCPYCRAADIAFKSRLDEIPAEVIILKTDYDSHAELKRKYGITYQHTFVQIDDQGYPLSKWNSGDIDNLLKYLK